MDEIPDDLLRAAQNVLDDINLNDASAVPTIARALLAQDRAATERERERMAKLVGLLRADLIRAVEGDADMCEGCGAPIFAEDDIATTADVRGCWGYVSEVGAAPCWRYRTMQGEERAWPECAEAIRTTP